MRSFSARGPPTIRTEHPNGSSASTKHCNRSTTGIRRQTNARGQRRRQTNQHRRFFFVVLLLFTLRNYYFSSTNHDNAESQSTNPFVDMDRCDCSTSGRKRLPARREHPSPKKFKKPSLIAEYASSESETTDDGDDEEDDIDELLNEVLEKEEKVESKAPHLDSYPSFETDCQSVIDRLADLESGTAECFTLRIQLEVGLQRLRRRETSRLFCSRRVLKIVSPVICPNRTP